MSMKSDSCDGGGGWHRQLVRRSLTVRHAVLIAVGCVATGCSHAVVVENLRTGATLVCRENVGGINPWSQTMGCVAEHVAQGWSSFERE
jgi:hypothetical protein